MAKEELLEMNGVVAEVLPDARYRVTLDNGHKLIAYGAGKMRKAQLVEAITAAQSGGAASPTAASEPARTSARRASAARGELE